MGIRDEMFNRRDFVKFASGVGAAGFVNVFNPSVLRALQSAVGDGTDASVFTMTDLMCFTSKDDSFAEEPSLAVDGNGEVWAVWLARKKDGKEAIVVSSSVNCFADVREIAADGYYDEPCIACDTDGETMVAWVSNVGDEWFVQYCMRDGEAFSAAKTVTKAADGRAKNPYLYSDNQGGFGLVWESYKNGRFDICLKEYSKGKWGKTIRISDGAANVYSPAVTVDRSGKVWIAYSKAENGERNIYLTSYDPKKDISGEEIAVCVGGARSYQCSHPSVFCDSRDRVWVAWERCDDKKKTDCYFGMSECFAVCYHGGMMKAVKANDPNCGGVKVFAVANNQRPCFVEDHDGRLWLFTREYIGIDVNVPEGSGMKYRRTWKIVGSFLDGEKGWSPKADVLRDVRFGRLGKTAVVSAEDGNVLVAWQGDNIWGPGGLLEPKFSDIYAMKVKLPDSSEKINAIRFEKYDAGEHRPVRFGRAAVKRRTVSHQGETYTLLYGNLHEHTNISRCWGDGSDGNLDDNYRYGIDVEGYDFIGMTDHGYDLHEEAWRKTRRAARFYTDGSHFVGLPSYEWTRTGGPKMIPGSGHRNVIFASDEDAAKFVDPKIRLVYACQGSDKCDMPDKLWKLFREKGIEDVVTIPHHTADFSHPMDWDFHDEEYQCVAEIFQCRQSCEHKGCPRQTSTPTEIEGCYVQDGLNRGYHMGFIASGDHNSMGIGIAAVLVKEVSPAGIVEALKARRCFATTGDKIYLDFSIDDSVMGTVIRSGRKPNIKAEVVGTDSFKELVIVRNGEIIYSRDAEQLKKKKQYSIDFTDEGCTGNDYYYLRVVQQDDEIAWSSPVWVENNISRI